MNQAQFDALYALMSKGGARTKPMRRALQMIYVDGLTIDRASILTGQPAAALQRQIAKGSKVIDYTYTLVTGEKPCKTPSTS